jgi:hypothetical protein
MESCSRLIHTYIYIRNHNWEECVISRNNLNMSWCIVVEYGARMLQALLATGIFFVVSSLITEQTLAIKSEQINQNQEWSL